MNTARQLCKLKMTQSIRYRNEVKITSGDKFRDDRSTTAVNKKSIDAVRYIIERQVPYHEIRASLGIGMSQIQSIPHKDLGMTKLCSQWISHNLTEAQKTDRVTWCNAMLTRFKEGTSNLAWEIVTEYRNESVREERALDIDKNIIGLSTKTSTDTVNSTKASKGFDSRDIRHIDPNRAAFIDKEFDTNGRRNRRTGGERTSL
ncbi:hypothetical protein EVAR_67458_1 [Eumeta japonica]|uniref:Uncharacterized protein n=1 Tax=Eumeta variegata TaxID=151549 RepID=A0A4C1ZUU6_EUMVA|nr:hypothetical protein EVAR_67458_1 [Eumeta japonica]